jgi:hypothetical protein
MLQQHSSADSAGTPQELHADSGFRQPIYYLAKQLKIQKKRNNTLHQHLNAQCFS